MAAGRSAAAPQRRSRARCTGPPDKSPLLGSLQAPFFSDDDRLRALFLATFSRQPTANELSISQQQLAKYSASDSGKAYSDILWALLNSAEFALNH